MYAPLNTFNNMQLNVSVKLFTKQEESARERALCQLTEKLCPANGIMK